MGSYDNTGKPIEPLTLNQGQPLDSLATHLMQTIARKGRGPILDLLQADGKTTIEVKESLKPHDEYQPLADYRKHDIDTTESFVAYAKKYGTSERSIIFANEVRALLVIDDQIERGERECIALEWKTHEDWQDWSDIVNESHLHKDLLKFLSLHEHNLNDPAILLALQSIRVNSSINWESDVSDDGKTIGALFKTSGSEDMKRFPKLVGIHLPIFEGDGDRQIDLRHVLELPDTVTQPPTFKLLCSKWKQILRDRITREIGEIRDELGDEWLVLQGKADTLPRLLGGKARE